MQINIQAKNLEITPSLKEYIEEKIGAVEKMINVKDDNGYGSHSIVAFVELERMMKNKKHGEVFRAEINLKWKGNILRVEEKEWDMRAAIDLLKDTLERRVRDFKDERITKRRRGERSIKKLLSLSPFARFRKK